MAMTDDDLDRLRRELADRLAALRRSTESTADDRKPVELDQTAVGRLSRMDALQMQAMAQATERRRAQEAARIEAALKRIGDGDYGWCVNCGEAIAPKRLAADPTVPTCIRCASGETR
jgi:DnaK suppressor protein